ncbi:hypothetical protein [Zhongshania sp.]|uniref:hypothetical protein n=1 Tax=Zhongshania sp. TaxID=1971902 RepID=UPI0035645F23
MKMTYEEFDDIKAINELKNFKVVYLYLDVLDKEIFEYMLSSMRLHVSPLNIEKVPNMFFQVYYAIKNLRLVIRSINRKKIKKIVAVMRWVDARIIEIDYINDKYVYSISCK